MWHWDWTGSGLDPLKAEWFGIPYANFVGWISVVFFYSFFSRMYERTIFKRPSLWRFPAVAVLALISAQVELLVTEYLVFHWLNAIHIGSGWRLLIEAAVLLGLVGWGMVHRGGSRRSKMPGVALWVPAWFHVYFVIALVALGFFRESAWMTLVAGVNIAIGLMIHLWPALRKKAVAGSLVWAEMVLYQVPTPETTGTPEVGVERTKYNSKNNRRSFDLFHAQRETSLRMTPVQMSSPVFGNGHGGVSAVSDLG
jgi:hypothetical protein